jgi:hypothetical protein
VLHSIVLLFDELISFFIVICTRRFGVVPQGVEHRNGVGFETDNALVAVAVGRDHRLVDRQRPEQPGVCAVVAPIADGRVGAAVSDVEEYSTRSNGPPTAASEDSDEPRPGVWIPEPKPVGGSSIIIIIRL